MHWSLMRKFFGQRLKWRCVVTNIKLYPINILRLKYFHFILSVPVEFERYILKLCLERRVYDLFIWIPGENEKVTNSNWIFTHILIYLHTLYSVYCHSLGSHLNLVFKHRSRGFCTWLCPSVCLSVTIFYKCVELS